MASLSQVLLTNEHWRQRFVAHVPEGEFGLEWAAGRGSLTDGLVGRWKYTLALEIDGEFCRELRHKYDPCDVGVIRADILSYPLPDRDWDYPLVGNLPYHLTGPLLEKLARDSNRLTVFHGLVQWEVARRIGASPGDSEYRSISVLMNWCFDVEVIDRVPSAAFSPEPDVDSGWIKLVPRKRDRPFDSFSSFIKRCFRQPRKTLLNNLAKDTDDKQRWREWMDEQNWDTRRRPSSLTLDETKEVYDRWMDTQSC